MIVQAMVPPIYSAYMDGRILEAIKLWQLLESKAQEIGVRGTASVEGLLFLVGIATDDVLKPYQGTFRPFQALRTLYLAYLGRYAEARAIIAGFGNIAADTDETAISILARLFEASILGSDTKTTEALFGRFVPLPDRVLLGSVFGWIGSIARHLGAAAVLLGRPDEGLAYYNQALEVCAKIHFRPEIALTHLQIAELLLEHRTDERAAAIDHLDFAIAEFREMKMQPSLERALRHKELLKA